MKRMKKLAGIVLAMVMVLSMSLTAFAADITIDDAGVEGASYSAFKLLNATDGGEGKFAYTVNTRYQTALQTVTGATEDADIVAYIGALDATGIRNFADAVYAQVKSLDADYTTTSNKFEGVDQGYYLIVETEIGTSPDGEGSDTYSLVMLDTAGNESITVETKEDVPTVDKQVEEINDSTTDVATWGESADYDIGDTINYKITGTVSSKYADYESYFYSFEDTMSEGLTLNQGSIVIMIGDVNVTEQFDVTTTAQSFIAKSNLKELAGVTVTADTEIIVTYTATLNDKAVSGTAGNTNEVVLKYENDPYHEGDGNPTTPDEPDEPGETPKDINIVFTFDTIVNKVDKDGAALAGAGFTLYKYDADAESADKWVAVGSEITGVTTFNFLGLDVGKYKLVETTVPAGYNKADDVEFSIEGVYDNTKDPVELTGLVVKDATGTTISDAEGAAFTTELTPGEIKTDIVNTTGVELPSTGGIGTTIFYIVGGVLVLGAVVVLIARRRMSMED